MNSNPSLTAIVLTYNEEQHLQRCLDSLKDVCQQIIVVDSFSTDGTEKIAIDNQVKFYENVWVNHAIQFNWALDNCPIATDWVIRVDADEYLSDELQVEIQEKLKLLPKSINGITIPLRRVFLNRHMKRGLGKIEMLRIFKTGKGRVESRWMDEHIELLEGDTVSFKGEFADHNLNTIGWWTAKHNAYSIKEAIELLDVEYNLLNTAKSSNISQQALKKRKLKLKYVKSPLFFRSFMYFIYRYILKLGFLDGKEGFLWHFLQGWWYRTLVDAKIYEIKKVSGDDVEIMKAYIKKEYKIDLTN
ncbi:MAG: glycosyl transferase [Lutibacter sp.]|nr:MAG: glycosyl transferase [Lutibacter sp.]